VIDDHVIGQDHARKVLSVAVYNHYSGKYDAGSAIAMRADAAELNDVESSEKPTSCSSARPDPARTLWPARCPESQVRLPVPRNDPDRGR